MDAKSEHIRPDRQYDGIERVGVRFDAGTGGLNAALNLSGSL